MPSHTTATDPDAAAVDFETLERRYTLAAILESWELLAMHSIAGDESIPRVRLRLMKELCGVEDKADEEERSVVGTPGSASRRRRG